MICANCKKSLLCEELVKEAYLELHEWNKKNIKNNYFFCDYKCLRSYVEGIEIV